MSIWFKEYNLENAPYTSKTTMMEHIGIRITQIGPDFLQGTMPVDHRTKQPAGILHGGASVTLAETLGSIASYLIVDPAKKTCVGLEINANHIRPVQNGLVTGIARPIHIGTSTHVWHIEIKDENSRLICISRLTIASSTKSHNDFPDYEKRIGIECCAVLTLPLLITVALNL